MNDRELLELAAKAAGICIDKSKYNGGWADNTGFDTSGNAVLDWHNCKTWNPLTDDGDAMRLAVKLNITIQFPWDEDCNMLRETRCWNDSDEPAIEHHSFDKLAATRRAIVRAAAEIGKAMQ